MNINTPKNAQQALQQATRFDRAEQIIKEGYTFHKDADSEVIAVCKPGSTAAAYWINMLSEGCDCPDYMKNCAACKHMIAWEILKEEEAGLEAQCKQWEEENPLDCIPTPTLMSLAIKDLSAAMETDLQKVNADIAAQGERRTGYIHCQHQHDRAGRLENALVIISQYKPL